MIHFTEKKLLNREFRTANTLLMGVALTSDMTLRTFLKETETGFLGFFSLPSTIAGWAQGNLNDESPFAQSEELSAALMSAVAYTNLSRSGGGWKRDWSFAPAHTATAHPSSVIAIQPTASPYLILATALAPNNPPANGEPSQPPASSRGRRRTEAPNEKPPLPQPRYDDSYPYYALTNGEERFSFAEIKKRTLEKIGRHDPLVHPDAVTFANIRREVQSRYQAIGKQVPQNIQAMLEEAKQKLSLFTDSTQVEPIRRAAQARYEQLLFFIETLFQT